MKLVLWLVIAAAAALVPAGAYAQSNRDRGGTVVRINGDYTLPAGEEVSILIVIRGDVTVEGRVNDSLFVVDGDAVVRGTLQDVVVIRGDLRLEAGATAGDISLFRSSLDRDPGATVTGDISRSSGSWVRPWGMVLGVLFFLGLALIFVATAMVFAAVGGRQLGKAATTMTRKPGESILGAVVILFGLPLLAVVLMVTLIGIPAGLGLLVVVFPALLLLGAVVAATWLGLLITSRQGESPGHPYGAAALGALIFCAAMLLPGIGFLAVSVLGLWGAGALLAVSWGAARTGPPAVPAAAPPPLA